MVNVDVAFTVDDLATVQALRSPCVCRVQTFQRRALIALVGRDTQPHLIGLNRELWCSDCGEPPFVGWVVQEEVVNF